MANLQEFLGFPRNWEVERVRREDDGLVVEVLSRQCRCACPSCGQMSGSIHSRYQRHPQDLPCVGQSLRLQLCVARFRCQNPSCSRATFVEPQGVFLPRYSRGTQRLQRLLAVLGFEAGGQGGRRLADQLHIRVSRATLLRVIRRTTIPPPKPVQILGVDDWAYCKGKRYGTLLVNLERHCVIDVLPDAEADTLVQWLREHPEIEVISRDRSGTYAEGSRRGAPQAQQVADRWHLLRNLWDALVMAYECFIGRLKRLVAVIEPPVEPPTEALPPVRRSSRPKPPPTPLAQARAARRQYWEETFAKVHDLHQRGWSNAAIARDLGVSLGTVKNYLKLKVLPTKRSPKFKPRLMDPFWDYLRMRLQQGSISNRELLEELRARGFKGSLSTVNSAMVAVRQELQLPSPLLAPKPAPPQVICTTPRQLATWVLSPELSSIKHDLVHQARQLHPDLELITGLAQDFLKIIRERKPQHLIPWIEAVQLTSLAALKRFAKGLLSDFDAVYAACTQPWSNGQVEGQINRLKFLKRQMYGRANFDLLRLRVLYSPNLLHEI